MADDLSTRRKAREDLVMEGMANDVAEALKLGDALLSGFEQQDTDPRVAIYAMYFCQEALAGVLAKVQPSLKGIAPREILRAMHRLAQEVWDRTND